MHATQVISLANSRVVGGIPRETGSNNLLSPSDLLKLSLGIEMLGLGLMKAPAVYHASELLSRAYKNDNRGVCKNPSALLVGV